MKSFLRIFLVIAIFLLFSDSLLAAGIDKYTPSTTVSSYVFKVDNPTMVDTYWTIFNAMAALFQSKSYFSVVKLVFTIGGFFVFLVAILKTVQGRAATHSSITGLLGYLLIGVSLMTVLFAKKTDIWITTDQVSSYCSTGSYLNNQDRTDTTVSNIPEVLAFTFTFFNRLGIVSTQLATTAFADPSVDPTAVDKIRSGYATYLEGISTLASMKVDQIAKVEVGGDKYILGAFFQAFIRDCVIAPAAADVSVGGDVLDALGKTGYIAGTLNKMFKEKALCVYKSPINPSDAANETCYTITGTGPGIELNSIDINNFYLTIGQAGTFRCGEAWDDIKAVIDDKLSSTDMFCGNTLKHSLNGLTMYALTGDPALSAPTPTNDVRNTVLQSALINSLNEAQNEMGVGSVIGYSQQKTMGDFVTSNLGTGYYMAKMIPYLQMGMRAVLYAFFPFVFIVVMLPGGIGVLLSYLQSLLWIELWTPTAAILNFFLMSVTKSQMKDMFETHGYNPMNMVTIFSDSAMLASIGGYLYASVPALTWLILKGSGQMLGSITGAMASKMSSNLDAGAMNQDVKDLEKLRETNKFNLDNGKDLISLGEISKREAQQAGMSEAGQFLGKETLTGKFGSHALTLNAYASTARSGARDAGLYQGMTDKGVDKILSGEAALSREGLKKDYENINQQSRDKFLKDFSELNQEEIKKLTNDFAEHMGKKEAGQYVERVRRFNEWLHEHPEKKALSRDKQFDAFINDEATANAHEGVIKEDKIQQGMQNLGFTVGTANSVAQFAQKISEGNDNGEKVPANSKDITVTKDSHGNTIMTYSGSATNGKSVSAIIGKNGQGTFIREGSDGTGKAWVTDKSMQKGLKNTRLEQFDKDSKTKALQQVSRDRLDRINKMNTLNADATSEANLEIAQKQTDLLAKEERLLAEGSTTEQERNEHLKNAEIFSSLSQKIGEDDLKSYRDAIAFTKTLGAEGQAFNARQADATANERIAAGVTSASLGALANKDFFATVGKGVAMFDNVMKHGSDEAKAIMQKVADKNGLGEEFKNGTLSDEQKTVLASGTLGELQGSPEARNADIQNMVTVKMDESSYGRESVASAKAIDEKTSAQFADSARAAGFSEDQIAFARGNAKLMNEISNTFFNGKRILSGLSGGAEAVSRLGKNMINNEKKAEALRRKMSGMNPMSKEYMDAQKELRAINKSTARTKNIVQALSDIKNGDSATRKRAISNLGKLVGGSGRAEAISRAVSAGTLTGAAIVGIAAAAGSELVSNVNQINSVRDGGFGSSADIAPFKSASHKENESQVGKTVTVAGRQMAVFKMDTDNYGLKVTEADGSTHSVSLKGLTDKDLESTDAMRLPAAFQDAATEVDDEGMADAFVSGVRYGNNTFSGTAYRTEAAVGSAADFISEMVSKGSDIITGKTHVEDFMR